MRHLGRLAALPSPARRRPPARALSSSSSSQQQHSDNATAVRALLKDAGLTQSQLSLAEQRDSHLLSYDARGEVAPRLAYLTYLRDVSPTRWAWKDGGESVAEYVTRQPAVLERRFSLLRSDGDFLALCKPWDTRHDTPRGWGEAGRFQPKWPGDDTSAEQWCLSLPPETAQWRDGGMPRFCHQLDFATSGLLLAATSRRAAAAAALCFKNRSADKSYTVILLGRPAAEAWTVDAPVGPDEADPQGFKMRLYSAEELAAAERGPPSRDAPRGARTEFRVLKRGFCALEGPFLGWECTLASAHPHTGRRHQIRLHAAAGGTPVLGDCAYSPDSDSFRMFLHATALKMPLRMSESSRRERRRVRRVGGAAEAEAEERGERVLDVSCAMPRSFDFAFRASE